MVIGNCSLKVFAYKTRGTLPVKILNSSVTTLLNQVAIISLDCSKNMSASDFLSLLGLTRYARLIKSAS